MIVAIEIGGQSTSSLSVVFGTLLVILVWVAVPAILYLVRNHHRSADEQRRTSLARSRLASWSGQRYVISAGDGLEAWRERCRAALDGRGEPQEGVGDVLTELRAAWRRRTAAIPDLALSLAGEAVLLTAFAGVMLVGADALRDGIGAGLTSDPIGSLVAGLSAVQGVALGVVGLFPASGVVWALVLSLVFLGGQWLVDHALTVAALLALGAVAITALDRTHPTTADVTLYPDRRRMAASIGAYLGGIFLAGSVPPLVFGALGAGWIGTAIGAVSSFVVAVVALALGVQNLGRRLVRSHPLHDAWPKLVVGTRSGAALRRRLRGEGLTFDGIHPRLSIDRGGLAASYAYVLARKAFATLGLIAVPVLVYLAGQALLTGRLWAYAMAYVAAPLVTKLLVAIVAVGGVALLARIDPDEWRALADATRRAASHQATQAVLFLAVIPLLAGIGIAAFLVAFGSGLTVGVVAGVVTAGVVRVGYRVFRRVTLTARTKSIRSGGRASVPTEWGAIANPDGEGEIYLARVGTRWYAWPEPGLVLDRTFEDIDALLSGDDRPRASLPQAYYDDLKDDGVTDATETIQARSTQAWRTVPEIVDGETRVETVREQLGEEYDPAIVERALRQLRERGLLSKADDIYRWHGS